LGLVAVGSLLASTLPAAATTEKEAMAAWAKRLAPAKAAFTKDYEQMLADVGGRKAHAITSESPRVTSDARKIAGDANSPSSSVNTLVLEWASDIESSATEALLYARHSTKAFLAAIVQSTYKILADEKAIGTELVLFSEAHSKAIAHAW
jgi:hypothetical protein